MNDSLPSDVGVRGPGSNLGQVRDRGWPTSEGQVDEGIQDSRKSTEGRMLLRGVRWGVSYVIWETIKYSLNI